MLKGVEMGGSKLDETVWCETGVGWRECANADVGAEFSVGTGDANP